ncbi:MAG: FAD-dependent oxidoreductase [Candidatus Babeliaceae bacterium]|jgi:thioredoxin reductase (NADPH)
MYNKNIILTALIACTTLIIGYIGITIHRRQSGHTSTPAHYSLKTLATHNNIIPLAIIGSGPAGLSAALYGARGKIHTIVFEGKQPGGQLTTTSYVENWPGISKTLGTDIIKGLRKQAQECGALCVPETIKQVNFSSWPFVLTLEDKSTVHAATVVIATGATPKKLGVPGEQEYWGKGVTTCAICDAPFFKNNNVIVVGGGDSAIEEALQLAPYVKQATIFVRSSQMRASAAMQEHLKDAANINIRYNVKITAIKGDDKFVHSVDIEENGTASTMPIDGVFLAIGHEPNTTLFTPYIAVDTNGYITLSTATQATSIPGIFAAGDVADHRYRQAGVASGDGIKAALDASEFLRALGYNADFEKEYLNKFYTPLSLNTKKLQKIGTNDEFTKEVTESPLPVVLDFYTDYCPSCLQMLPTVEAIAQELEGKIKFLKVNALEFNELAEKLEVPTVPTLVVMSKGAIVGRTHDVMNKQELLHFVNQFIQA